ncbi:MAG: serine protease, partial [Candidatus Hydrogenedentales bacterium]
MASSCSNLSEVETKALNYSVLKRDELLALAEADQEACIEALSVISISKSQDSSLAEENLAEFASLATEKLVSRFSAELNEGRWKSAEKSLASLLAIESMGQGVFVQASRVAGDAAPRNAAVKIFLGRAEEYAKRNLYSPAAAYIHKALDASSLPGGAAKIDPSLLEAWYARAAKAGDGATMRRILSFSAKERADYLSQSIGIGKLKTEIGEMAGGVVTVHVDKGLKIENGVGYPERILGTAFQVDSSGYYITNYHVISSEVDPAYNGYSRLSIRPPSNPEARIPAKVVGWNEDLDLAVLKSQEISSHTFYPFKPEKAFKG